MPIQIVHFFLCKFWQIVSFKELVPFVYIVKSVAIKLLAVFLYYLFNVRRICSDIYIFPGVSNYAFSLFFLINLVGGLPILLIFFQGTTFYFSDFL